MAKIRLVQEGMRFLPTAAMIATGQRFCSECSSPLTGDVLLAQAEELMRPYIGMPIKGKVREEVTVILQRAAGPLHSGFNCCYACAYALSAPEPNVVQ